MVQIYANEDIYKLSVYTLWTLIKDNILKITDDDILTHVGLAVRWANVSIVVRNAVKYCSTVCPGTLPYDSWSCWWRRGMSSSVILRILSFMSVPRVYTESL